MADTQLEYNQASVEHNTEQGAEPADAVASGATSTEPVTEDVSAAVEESGGAIPDMPSAPETQADNPDVTVDEKPSVQQEEHANEVSKSASSEDEPVAPQTETPATNSYSAPAPAPVYSAPATAVSGYQPPSSTPAPAVSQSTGYQPPSYSAAPSMAAVSGNHNAHSGSYQPSMQQSGSRPPAPADGDESIQARKIFLGGLPGPTTEEELMGVFSNFGPVQETIVIRRNGRPRGFGFVIFQTKAGADAVLAAHNSGGVVIGGRTIDCKSTFARGSDAEKKHGATQPAPGAAPHQSASYGDRREPFARGGSGGGGGGPNSTSNKVFVGALPLEAGDRDLHATLEVFGPIAEAIVMKNRESGQSRGFGFVTFTDPSAFSRAVAAHRVDMMGRTIEIKAAAGKRDAPPSRHGGGGGGSGGGYHQQSPAYGQGPPAGQYGMPYGGGGAGAYGTPPQQAYGAQSYGASNPYAAYTQPGGMAAAAAPYYQQQQAPPQQGYMQQPAAQMYGQAQPAQVAAAYGADPYAAYAASASTGAYDYSGGAAAGGASADPYAAYAATSNPYGDYGAVAAGAGGAYDPYGSAAAPAAAGAYAAGRDARGFNPY